MDRNPYPTKSQAFFARLATIVVQHRLWLLLGLAGITAFFGTHLKHVRVDNANDTFFIQTDPALKAYRNFQKEFGSDEFVLILLEGENLFTPEAHGAAGGKDVEKRELLARHLTIATYKGAPFRLCRGETARCPKDCGSSGEFATFAIGKYLEYEKLANYGSSKQTSHLIQVSGFHRKPVGDPEILKVISQLKVGDHVLLAWDHDYVTSNRVSAPDRPIKKLRRLTEEEEDKHFPR